MQVLRLAFKIRGLAPRPCIIRAFRGYVYILGAIHLERSRLTGHCHVFSSLGSFGRNGRRTLCKPAR